VVLGRRGELARQIASSLQDAVGVEADLADDESIAAAFAQTLDRFGALHININTAGIIDNVPIVSPDGAATPVAEFQRLVSTNLVGTWSVMSRAAAAMICNEPDEGGERGVIVRYADPRLRYSGIARGNRQGVPQPQAAWEPGGIRGVRPPPRRERLHQSRRASHRRRLPDRLRKLTQAAARAVTPSAIRPRLSRDRKRNG
jgi:hypothetical protein